MYRDRVKDTTSTIGTGPVVLGNVAPTGYQTFATAFGGSATVAYCIADQAGTQWEVGTGVFNGTTGLTRVTVLGSSNGGALVNFGIGTKDVFCTAPAAYLLPPGATTQVAYNNAGLPGASSNFTYDSATNTVTFGNITGSALAMTIQPKAPTVLELAGKITLQGSAAQQSNTDGGSLELVSGVGNGTGAYGTVKLKSNTTDLTVSDGSITANSSGQIVFLAGLTSFQLNTSSVQFGDNSGTSFQVVNGGMTLTGGACPVVDTNIEVILPINVAGTGCTEFRVTSASAVPILRITDTDFASPRIGFFDVTPVVRRSAYTQTFSTASRTVSNPTFSNVSTTAATNVAPWGFSTQAQADALATKVNQLAADVVILRQLINSLIDDQQAYGFAQ
jgi:hypothetical protein